MNPQLNTFHISQGSPAKPTTHPQASSSKVLIPEEPSWIWSSAGAVGVAKAPPAWEGRSGQALGAAHLAVKLLWGLTQAVCSSSAAAAGTARGKQEEQQESRGRIYFRLLQNEQCSFTLCGETCSGFPGQSPSPVVPSLFQRTGGIQSLKQTIPSLCNVPAGARRGALSKKRGQKMRKHKNESGYVCD